MFRIIYILVLTAAFNDTTVVLPCNFVFNCSCIVSVFYFSSYFNVIYLSAINYYLFFTFFT